MEERRQLLEVVGPDLQSQLDSLGIEVEMVDIHYGTQYDAVYDVNTIKHQLNEIKHCYQVSRGCFLLVSIKGAFARLENTFSVSQKKK